MKITGLMIASAVLLASQAAASHAQDVIVREALADPARADQSADDQQRKAADVLSFAGLHKGEVVVDFIPGNGYWTRIFSSAVGPTGRVYAVWPEAAGKFATKALPALQARRLGNVSASVIAGNVPVFPSGVDMFWTVQNYHDVANDGGAASLRAFDKSVYASLKPGGIFVVIDHNDAPGTGISGTSERHRIEKAAVLKQVTAAGFLFVGESAVLANPADDHKATVFDPAIRGHTDKFVLKFRKPAR